MTPRLLVLDASAAVELLRRSVVGERVARVLSEAELVAPAHLDAEALSALGRLARAGAVPGRDVDRALDLLAILPLERYPLPPLLRRAWAMRENIALRDGLYVACAELIGAALVTLDARLARAVPDGIELVT